MLASSTQPLELAFFADDGLALNKIALRVTGGDDYNLSQRWSGAVHRYHPLVDSSFDISRHYNGPVPRRAVRASTRQGVFDRPHLAYTATRPDLFGQTAALLRRFQGQIRP